MRIKIAGKREQWLFVDIVEQEQSKALEKGLRRTRNPLAQHTKTYVSKRIIAV